MAKECGDLFTTEALIELAVEFQRAAEEIESGSRAGRRRKQALTMLWPSMIRMLIGFPIAGCTYWLLQWDIDDDSVDLAPCRAQRPLLIRVIRAEVTPITSGG